MKDIQVIDKGSTICILGGGQLALMLLVAAKRIGYKVIVWAEKDAPAVSMADHRFISPYTNRQTLEKVLSLSDVITTEWENIPLHLIIELEQRGALVRPGSNVLRIAQSRAWEKATAKDLDILITRTAWLPQQGAWSADWQACLPGILKTNKLGYDGKGQWTVATEKELQAAWKTAGVDCVLEKLVELQSEVSVLVARTADGHISLSDVVENTHRNGILHTATWPPRSLPPYGEQVVHEAATDMAEHLHLEGVLVLEFFVAIDGHILLNEMAPRPHNSFHGANEAAWCSQFEQLVRAVCGQPLGEVRFRTVSVMTNLLGHELEEQYDQLMVRPKTFLYDYGKEEVREGRKMGHFNTLYPDDTTTT